MNSANYGRIVAFGAGCYIFQRQELLLTDGYPLPDLSFVHDELAL